MTYITHVTVIAITEVSVLTASFKCEPDLELSRKAFIKRVSRPGVMRDCGLLCYEQFFHNESYESLLYTPSKTVDPLV